MGLIVIILSVYMQAGNHQFVFDDEAYVTSNPHVASGLTKENIIWAFTSVHAANWHPITWLSHMADTQFYGLNPRGHHLTNVGIHAVNVLLLLFLLFRTTSALWQSAFVAALFALHPLHVESVAWVAERKDLLSALFCFLTLFFYSEYVMKQKATLYILALFSFMLGLMSKPMLVTLPLVMLLMDFWPLDRFRHTDREHIFMHHSGRLRTLIKEKIPFFACSLCSSAVTIYAQHKGGAMVDLVVIPFHLRLENALSAYIKYIGKILWPCDLAVFYPFPLTIPLWQTLGSLFVLLLLSVAAIRARRRYPYFAVGWFWFLVTLLPVIGIIQVGMQSMADRYSYIPVIGLFIMVAWGAAELAKNVRQSQGLLALFAGAVLVVSTVLTSQQLGYWYDSISLYRHTLKVTTGSSLMHYNLGAALANNGDLDEAIREFQEAIRLDPDNFRAHKNLTRALVQRMKTTE
jgi:tetratricopeptide (TPR) repeat protein